MAPRNPADGTFGDAAGADDPFWSVVRARHPDVDVVVLPPEARESFPRVTGEELDRRRRALADLVARLAGSLPDGVPAPVVEESAGPAAATILLRARTHGTTADGEALLAAWAAEFPGARRRPGNVDVLDGDVDGLRLHATWARPNGVLVLRVDTGVLEVVR